VPAVADLVANAEEALLLAVVVSLPVVVVAALAGVIVAALQAATQIQDPTVSHLPRLVVVAVVLALAAPWMGSQIAGFAARMLGG
jgi:type III secretion HrpO family protein